MEILWQLSIQMAYNLNDFQYAGAPYRVALYLPYLSALLTLFIEPLAKSVRCNQDIHGFTLTPMSLMAFLYMLMFFYLYNILKTLCLLL